MDTHYASLKVMQDAPDEVIRGAYRALSQKHHPDRNNDPASADVMARINEAYRVLSDPRSRAEHDEWIWDQESRRRYREAERPAEPAYRYGPAEGATQPGRQYRHVPPGLWIVVFLVGSIVLWSGLFPSRAEREASRGALQAGEGQGPDRTPLLRPRMSAYDRAPTGKRWPARAAYVSGFPVKHDKGRSTVTVDNTGNDSDVFVKLVAHLDGITRPVRHLYVPAGSSFRISNVNAGEYELRYRSLATGDTSKTALFELAEIVSSEGRRSSNVTMTLKPATGGPLRAESIAPAHF